MKKLILLIAIPLLTLAIPHVEAATPPGIIYYSNPWCGTQGLYPCPITYMKNRTNTKILAVYAPNGTNTCDTGSMSVWILGHPKVSGGFTTNDWQDLEIAKQQTGGYYRWGCCRSSDAYNYICLR